MSLLLVPTDTTTAGQRILGPGAPAVSAPTGDALAALVGPVGRPVWGADVYESDGVTLYLADVLLTDGSVTVDSTRDERRMFDVTFGNADGRLVHGAGSFWYDKILKFYRGVQWNGGTWGCQVGECMIDKIVEASFPGTMEVTGRDYTKKLLIDELVADTAFAAGTFIEDVVNALVINSGVDPARMVVPATGIQLAADYTITQGTTYKKAVDDLVTAYGYEEFFRADGTFLMRLFQDPAVTANIWTFLTGMPDGNLISWTKTSDDSNLKNHQVVIATSSSSTAPVWAEALNTDPNSPTNIDAVGDRVNTTTTVLPLDEPGCLLMAQNYLAVSALEDYEIDMSSLVFPHLEAGAVVDFIDPNANPGEPTAFLLTSFDIPLKLGPSSPVAKRVALVT